MDEITAVCKFRDNAPTPDRARLAPGRQRLLEAARGATPRRTQLGWRLVPVGAAAALAAVVMATQFGPDGTGAPQEPQLSNTAAVLEKAADTIEGTKLAEPRPHQWIYIKSGVEFLPLGGGPESEESEPKPGTFEEREEWIRYDGKKTASRITDDPKSPVVTDADHDSDERTPQEWYRLLASLPTDPDELLKTLRTKSIINPSGDTRAERDFTEMRVLLGSTFLFPPDVQATLYRALATIPGVKVTDHLVKDAAGRDAIAVTFTDPKPDKDGSRNRYELLLNPDSYAYLGMRMVAAEDYQLVLHDDRLKIEKGQRRYNKATISTTVVDKAGQTR